MDSSLPSNFMTLNTPTTDPFRSEESLPDFNNLSLPDQSTSFDMGSANRPGLRNADGSSAVQQEFHAPATPRLSLSSGFPISHFDSNMSDFSVSMNGEMMASLSIPTNFVDLQRIPQPAYVPDDRGDSTVDVFTGDERPANYHHLECVSRPSADAITSFDTDPNTCPGFKEQSDCNLVAKLFDETGVKLNKKFLSNCSPWGDRFVVGTADFGLTATAHYLMVCEKLENEGRIRLLSYLKLEEAMSDVHWVSANVVVAAVAKGRLCTFHIDPVTSSITLTKTMVVQQGDTPNTPVSIRQVAVNKFSVNQVATGGALKNLVITDINAPTAQGGEIFRVQVNGTIGSLKWNSLLNSISLTLDSGKVLCFDTREPNLGRTSPAFEYDTGGTRGLYSHEFYTEHHMLIGFGSGAMHHLDIRNMSKNPLSMIQDPYVEGIGEIVYNSTTGGIVTSGRTDFSVWNLTEENVAKLWSHRGQGANRFANSNGEAWRATFRPGGKEILASSTEGCVGIFEQNFRRNHNAKSPNLYIRPVNLPK